MLNYETLLSSYDDKLTLMQWLKNVEAALKDASAVSFDVNKKGDATLTFSITFEDGSKLESGEIVLQQGESVESAAIVNGHLILTLTNGDELDAGQLLNGDLNVSGNLAVTGKITGAEIVEDMAGYSATLWYATDSTGYTLSNTYVSAVKNGNKLTLVYATMISQDGSTATGNPNLVIFRIPAAVASKIFPVGLGDAVDVRQVSLFSSQYGAPTLKTTRIFKSGNALILQLFGADQLTAGTNYFVRIEATFLLSDNLVG